MPGHPTDPEDSSIVPLNNVSSLQEPVVYPLRHGLSPLSRIHISWSRGNVLHVSCLRKSVEEGPPDGEVGGKVLEVRFGGGDGEFSEAEMRRIAYGSLPAFAVLQSKKNALSAIPMMAVASPSPTESLQHGLEYSSHIKALLGTSESYPSWIIEDPRTVLKGVEKPTTLRAAWELIEIFYADKQSFAWLPERIVDWLADYDSLMSNYDSNVHSKLMYLQKRLVGLQCVEDDPEYWGGVLSALAVGWLDIVVKLLRMHGSYQPDQLDKRETENGLVEAIAVLVSTMPRMRSDLFKGKLGQCYRTKTDFIKAWEKWKGQLAKLDCSVFWVQCGNNQTQDGLKKMLQIMLGNVDCIKEYTYNWMELYVSHLLYMRPLTSGFDGLYSLAHKCMEMKPVSESCVLMRLIHGILGENTEVVLGECSRTFGAWMVTHAIELLTLGNYQTEIILHEERYNLGGISIMELHRLVYAQLLSFHALTWQIAPTYLVSCPKQGLGFLEILLHRQPVQHYQMLLKNLEICRLYELEDISSSIMKIAGMHHWKHGRKGLGIYWLQQAHDEFRLNRIAQELFNCIGKSISDDSFKQWEGLIELLGSEAGKIGGLKFLHEYHDFKRCLQLVQDIKCTVVAQQAVKSLIKLVQNPATPQRFWLTLLHDSIKLLNWPDHPLLNASQTNLLLNKLQDVSLARLGPDFCETILPPQALSSIRLALGTNLGRAILEEC